MEKIISAEAFEVCSKCGGIMQRVSEENSSPLIMECQNCAHREYASVLISPPDLNENKVQYCRVLVHIDGINANADEIHALRKLSQELGTLPLSEAVNTIRSSTFIDLGFHTIDDAKDLLKRAESLNLEAIMLDESENPHIIEAADDGQVIDFGPLLIVVLFILALIVWMLL